MSYPAKPTEGIADEQSSYSDSNGIPELIMAFNHFEYPSVVLNPGTRDFVAYSQGVSPQHKVSIARYVILVDRDKVRC